MDGFPLSMDILIFLPSQVNPDLIDLLQEFQKYIVDYKCLNINDSELWVIKNKLKLIYEAGPYTKSVEVEHGTVLSFSDEEEKVISDSHISIPTETFLEELSVKMKLHPISVYWLLEELRAEGVRCKPEEQRLLEDRLMSSFCDCLDIAGPNRSKLVNQFLIGLMRMVLFLSFPVQESARYQIICVGVWLAEDGAISAQQTERLLAELTGQNLEQWLHTSFFTRHISQFKHRPIAWHLASTPVRGSNAADKGQKKKRVIVHKGLLFLNVLSIIMPVRETY